MLISTIGMASFRTSSDKLTFISENMYFVVPGNSKQIFVSMVGGGGRGGIGSIQDGLFIAGGGGGAGGACSRIPFYNEGYVSFDCRVGKGGNEEYPNGNDTEVDIYIDDVFNTTFSVKGGKSAEGKLGGLGGKGYYTFNGLDGSEGTVSLSSHLPVAGAGGSSIHYNGGVGMTYDMLDNSQTNGNWGSGGGGGLPGADSLLIGNGGDGFIVIEYI